MRPQGNLAVVVGDEVAAGVGFGHVTDDGNVFDGFDFLVIFLFHSEEEFVILTAVECDGGGHDLQFAEGLEGEGIDGGFVFVDGAAEAVEVADVEKGGGKSVADDGHGGGEDVVFAEGFDDVEARFRLQLAFQQVFVALEVGLVIACGFEDVLLALEEEEASVGGAEVARHADEFVFAGAGAAGEAVGFDGAEGGEADGESGGGGGEVEGGDVEVVVVAAGAQAGEEFFDGFDGEAVGDGDVDRELRRCGVHGEEVGDGDAGTLVPEVLEREVGEVEVDVFEEQFRGGHREAVVEAGGGCVVTDAHDGGGLLCFDVVGKLVDEVELSELGNLVAWGVVVCHILYYCMIPDLRIFELGCKGTTKFIKLNVKSREYEVLF